MEINKIYNEDCLEGLKKIHDNSIDLICTDPPYRLTSRGGYSNTGGMLKKDLTKKGYVFDNNDCSVKEWMPILYRVLKEGSHCYIMINHTNLIEYLNVSKDCGFHFIKSLIWDKQNKIMGQAYMSQFEYILFLRKGSFKKVCDSGISDILSFPNKKTKDRNGDNLHDTEKPIGLMQLLIMQSTKEDDLVLDPFMGIGTTAIAAIKAKRNYIGFELSPNYCKVAEERIKMEKATLTLF